jgi:hypothetical protein
MPADIECNLGEQPIARIMAENHLTRHALVEISAQHITHKMVARACKGRRLTPHAKKTMCDAVNQATGRSYSTGELFNY